MKRPSDRELDDIKQLLGARTIHYQLGIDIDKTWTTWATWAPREGFEAMRAIEGKMAELFGNRAIKLAAHNQDGTAYRSMYDTAMMRVWWEKFGGTHDVRGSAGDGEVGGQLGVDHQEPSDSTAELRQDGDGDGVDT